MKIAAVRDSVASLRWTERYGLSIRGKDCAQMSGAQ